MAREVERDDLDVTPDHVLVLKNAGPKGGPGMPEWGMLPIPKKLVQGGVRDMVRISDGRMSGTSYGACILHVAPESFVGGPLAFVQTGDEIEVDVRHAASTCMSATRLARRRAAWQPPPPRYARGYGAMFSAHIGQADEGCDFDSSPARSRLPSRRFTETGARTMRVRRQRVSREWPFTRNDFICPSRPCQKGIVTVGMT